MEGSEPTDICAVYTGTRAPTEAPERVAICHAPLLEAESIPVDEARLADLLTEPSGIVVYSRNAVRAIEATGIGELLRPTAEHTWWAVGRKTAEMLEARLGVEAQFPREQNFDGLKRALAGADLPARVVTLSLEGKRRDLGPALSDRGIAYTDVPVYRTVPIDYDSPYAPFRSADWVLFASARAVRVFDRLAGEDEAAPIDGEARIAAIGPKTAAELRSRDYEVAFEPEQPSLTAMLEAIASTAG